MKNDSTVYVSISDSRKHLTIDGSLALFQRFVRIIRDSGTVRENHNGTESGDQPSDLMECDGDSDGR